MFTYKYKFLSITIFGVLYIYLAYLYIVLQVYRKCPGRGQGGFKTKDKREHKRREGLRRQGQRDNGGQNRDSAWAYEKRT